MTLQAVEPGEKPQKRLTVEEAAAQASTVSCWWRYALVSLSRWVLRTVPPVALAALSRQLVLISKELSVLDSSAEEDPIGQAAATPDEPRAAV